MANKKISELPAVVTPDDTDQLEVNQAGTSKRETRAQLVAGVAASLASLTAASVGYTPSGELTATNVQAALDELEVNKVTSDGAQLAAQQWDAGLTGTHDATTVKLGNNTYAKVGQSQMDAAGSGTVGRVLTDTGTGMAWQAPGTPDAGDYDPRDGTAAGDNVTSLANTAGTGIGGAGETIKVDQNITLDNAVTAGKWWQVNNVHATDTIVITVEAGAGGTGAINGASTYRLPPGGEITLRCFDNTVGDQPQCDARGDSEISDILTYALSDETTDLEAGTAKLTFRMPYDFKLAPGGDGVRASVGTAPTGAAIIVDINEGGVSILSTKLSIDATEKTSTTAATPPVLSDTILAEDAEITVDLDQIGSTVAGAGLKLQLRGARMS